MKEMKNNQNVWVCLYILTTSDNDSKRYLLYGYAVDADDFAVESWGTYNLDAGNFDSLSWQLNRLTTVLTYEDAKKFVSSWTNETQTLSVNGKKIEIYANLHYRPEIYIPTKDFRHLGPESLTSESLLQCESWWCLDKLKFLELATNLPLDSFEILGESIFRKISTETGFDLLGKSSARIGNFEWFRYPIGSYNLPPGIHWEIEKETLNEKDFDVRKIKVQIEAPATEKYSLFYVQSILYSGNDEVIYDQIKQWNKGEKPLEFGSNQTISSVEVRVWEGNSGKLIYWDHKYLIRELNMNMALLSNRIKIISPWIQHLEKKGVKPERTKSLEEIQHFSIERLIIGGYQKDPWVPSSRRAREEISALFPEEGKGLWISKDPEGEVDAFLKVRNLFDQGDVQRVMIVDPFFGVKAESNAIGQLLCGIQHTGLELCVITSLILLKQKGKTYDSAKKLKELCRENYKVIYRNLRILNITKGNEQAFHDRYLLIWQANRPTSEVFLLSNSFSGMARKFPLVVVPVPPDVAKQIENYVRNSIEKAKNEGNYEILWDAEERNNIMKAEREKRTPLSGPFGLPLFQGWKTIFSTLGFY